MSNTQQQEYGTRTADSAKDRGPMIPRSAGAAQFDKLRTAASESWMHPGKVILAGIVIGVLIGLILYYTTTSLLQVVSPTSTGGTSLFESSNWLTLGGGILFLLIVTVVLALGGASIGMSWKNNGQAAIWTMLATAFIGIMYYFVFASAKDGRKDQFALWSVLATIVGIALPGYGWWQTKLMADDAKVGHGPDKDDIIRRATWGTGMFIGSSVFSLIAAVGLWKIYSALK